MKSLEVFVLSVLLPPADLSSLRYAETNCLTCPHVPAFPSRFLCLLSLSPATLSAPSSTPAPSETHLCCETPHLQGPHIAVSIPLSTCFLSLNLLTSECCFSPCSFQQESEPLHLPRLFKDKVFLGSKRLLLFAQQNKALPAGINNVSRLNWSFFPGKEHPCNCPALKSSASVRQGKGIWQNLFPTMLRNVSEAQGRLLL